MLSVKTITDRDIVYILHCNCYLLYKCIYYIVLHLEMYIKSTPVSWSININIIYNIYLYGYKLSCTFIYLVWPRNYKNF